MAAFMCGDPRTRPLRTAIVAVAVAAAAFGGLPQTVLGQAPARSTPGVDANIDAERLLVRGMTRAYVGDIQAAIRIYERALEKAPQEATILSALADAHAAREDLTSALFYARQARDQASSNPHYHRELARLQREAGRLADAVSTARDMVERFPDDADARRLLAEMLVAADQPREALSAYDQLLDVAPADEVDIRHAMLRLYRRLDDPDGIERTLHALADLRPADRSYRLELGRLYRQDGQLRAAIDVYRTLLGDHPSDPALVSDLAALYWQTDQPERADSLLRRYTRQENATPEQRVGQAQALYRGAAVETASDTALTRTITRLLESALEQAPSNATALQLLGQLRYDAGQYADAGSLLTQALDQNPKAPARWVLAASAYLQADQADLAADTAEEGLLLFPGQFPLVRISAFAHLKLEQHRHALSRMQEAIDLSADVDTVSAAQQADLYEGLGTIHRRLGDAEAARRAWQQALNLDPDRNGLREQMRALPN